MTGQGRFEATHSLAYMPVLVNRGKAEQLRTDTRACARTRRANTDVQNRTRAPMAQAWAQSQLQHPTSFDFPQVSPG